MKKNSELGGALLMVSGCAFLAAAYLGNQVAFVGVAAALIAIGAALFISAKG